MEPIIRKRKEKDSLELAHCIANAWNTTYKGLVDDSFLKGLIDGVNANAERLTQNINSQPNYYVLTLQNKIIGWVYFTLENAEMDDAAEIHSLYILKDYQKRGYGKLLYNYAVNKISQKGFKKYIIGCLKGNPSNDFYKHLGGKYIGNRPFREKYLENIYLFEL